MPFFYKFFHGMDVERVVKGSPWHFFNNIILLRELVPGNNPKATELTSFGMWL